MSSARPGAETADHAGHRPAAQGERDDDQQHQVRRHAAGQRQPVEHGQLEHERDEQEHDRQQDTAHVSPPCPATATAWAGCSGRAADAPCLVTVGVGVACGLGGSTEFRGLTRGGTTTTPTTPSEAEVDERADQRLVVSELGEPSSLMTVPIGTPGT